MSPKAALWILLSLLLTQGVLGLSLSPGINEIDAVPGFQATILFRASNPGHPGETPVFVNIQETDDPLAQYISIDGASQTDNLRLIIPEGGEVTFTASVTLPEALPEGLHPGKHDLYIGISEDTNTAGGGQFVISTNVYSLMRINVPYPDTYADVGVDAPDIEYGKAQTYTVGLTNRGMRAISLSRSNIDIHSGDAKVQSLESLTMENIQPGETRLVHWTLPPKALPAGAYRALAHVTYDGVQRDLEARFRVGSEDLSITNTTGSLPAGAIRKYNVYILSGWNNALRDVYANIRVLREGKELTSAKSPFLDELKPWGEGVLIGYLDTSELSVGTYDAEVTVHFGNKQKKITTELAITPDTGEPSAEMPAQAGGAIPLQYVLIATGMLMLLFSILIIALLLRKR